MIIACFAMLTRDYLGSMVVIDNPFYSIFIARLHIAHNDGAGFNLSNTIC